MKTATLVFLVKEGPRPSVLLGFKKTRFGQGKWNGFGGKVNAGETVERAAVRELEEEAGVRVAERELRPRAHLTFLFPAKPEWDQVVHVFVVDAWQGAPAESAEMKPRWFTRDELPLGQMWRDDPHWLPLVLAGKKVSGTFTFKSDNESIETFSIKEQV